MPCVGQCPGISPEIRTCGRSNLAEMVMPMPPSGSNSPDVNYPPPKQKYVDPADPPDGYYEASDAPLRTRVLRRVGQIVGAIRPSRGN